MQKPGLVLPGKGAPITDVPRPALCRLLPSRLKTSLYYRYYHERARHPEWSELFKCAPLLLCPKLRMYDLVPGDVISGNIAFNGFYELELSRTIVALARKSTLLVDVGANMGYFSILWTGANPDARSIAFEVAPRNLALLANNIASNGLSDRIRLIPKAAGHVPGTVSFDVGPEDQTGWGGISARAGNDLQVPLVRLDDELGDIAVDVLKVDVEGADTWVLYGCRELLRGKRIRKIFFEQNEVRMAKLGIGAGDALEFLRGLGYRCAPLTRDRSEWMAVPAERP